MKEIPSLLAAAAIASAHANCFTPPVQTRTEIVRGPGNNTAQHRLRLDLQVERDDTFADARLTFENAKG
jgi:hypothetical protein